MGDNEGEVMTHKVNVGLRFHEKICKSLVFQNMSSFWWLTAFAMMGRQELLAEFVNPAISSVNN